MTSAMRRLLLPLTVLTYAVAFHYAYAAYINPVFEYAHYDYFPPSPGALVLTYLFVLTPSMVYRRSEAPAMYGATLIFVLCYIPTQMILLFNWSKTGAELALVQGSLTVSMAFLLATAGAGWRHIHWRAGPGARLSRVLGCLTLVGLAVLIVTYREHMRIVSFEDVYDLRFESNEIQTGVITDYLISWLSYCFLPFYFARGLLRKSLADIALAMSGSVLIYSSTGSKAAILMPVIIFILHRMMLTGRDFLLQLLAVLAAGIFVIITFLPDEGPLLWIKSILMIRILGTGGWTIFTYYDYFTTNGLTYYSHIGPVNAVLGTYPYGNLSLGQVIGLEYSGTEAANFNANFWASDGFAALGILGIPVVTAVLFAVFFVINRISSRYSPHFVVLWLAGFWLALLNLPLTTALLSAGGGLTMLLLWSTGARHRPRKRASADPSGDGDGSLQILSRAS